MNVEIEAKMRLSDPEAVESRLAELGAVFKAELLETNTYFDTEERTLKSADEGLRIRIERDIDGRQEVSITHKGPRAHGQLKSRSETQVQVASAGDAAALLRALGYSAVLSFEKRRRRWELDGCEVDVDTLPCIGSFVEIEGPSDEAVLAARDRLGLSDAPLIRSSYIAMLISHIREHHLQTTSLRFEPSAACHGAGA